MPTNDRYSREDVLRILNLSARQLDQWERLQLVASTREPNGTYDFRDLIGLRTVKQLIESGVPPARLSRAVAALREQLSHVEAPLTELRVLSDGRDVVVERGGSRLEPLSGQFILNFETRELEEKVRAISIAFSADDWFARALALEASRASRREAIDAYEQALRLQPAKIEALLNCGTLYYEQGNLEKAFELFSRAAEAAPENPLAHSNLGTVLDELGQREDARRHLRQAVRLDPTDTNARYNLAFVCEKLGALTEAREHWQHYVRLDPAGPWNAYARQRLAAAASAGK